jgi:hypothetical protein
MIRFAARAPIQSEHVVAKMRSISPTAGIDAIVEATASSR